MRSQDCALHYSASRDENIEPYVLVEWGALALMDGCYGAIK